MTSIRKIESNKRNASKSTGPRTPGGKLRSRRNARRHGLATRIEDDPGARGGIDCLAAILAEGSDDFDRIEKSRVLAESQFERRRIRVARYEIFLSINDMENVSINDFQIAMRAIDAIIPRPIDQNRCAHWRNPMDMIFQGRSMSVFQA